LPPNPWPGRVDRYDGLAAACAAGVAGEVANAEMYERLLAATQRPEIATVLKRLQQASQKRHLPAFERCAQRGDGDGGEAGGGSRRRWRGGRP